MAEMRKAGVREGGASTGSLGTTLSSHLYVFTSLAAPPALSFWVFMEALLHRPH